VSKPKGVGLNTLWRQAEIDAERVSISHRILTDPTRVTPCDPHILKSVEEEIRIREGICRALAWMQDHEEQIAEIMKREKVR
jgi:hypothetical protein